jgi:RNA polymerase sigma factor (sigma-70 family)
VRQVRRNASGSNDPPRAGHVQGMTDERRARFDVLFATYSRDVVAYCGWRAASSADAQDAVSEVFLTAWRRLDDVPVGDAARAWLYATARRVIANQRRAGRRRTALSERLAHVESPTAVPAPGSEAALVREALLALSPVDREVLLLSEWEGLSPAEIAAVLGCLAVTARGRLHRARSRLRDAFERLVAADQAGPRPRQPAVTLAAQARNGV